MSPTASSSTYTFSTKQDLKSARQVTSEEIWKAGRELGFSDNAIKVIEKRYLVRNEQGEIIETPKGMFHRMARALAEVETHYGADETQVKFWEKEFYGVLSRFEFTPAGRTITNAGAPTRVVANCIVLHFDDSMDGIFSTLHDASLLQQAGSGLGFAWHLLRPAGTVTVASRGQASGPVPFLNAYNHAFGVIKQQGRHGANMGVMRVDHPDILEFIDCKRKEGDIVNFNISIALTDEFMKAVRADSKEPWFCEWKGKKMKPRVVKRNNRGAYLGHEDITLTARELSLPLPIRICSPVSFRSVGPPEGSAGGSEVPAVGLSEGILEARRFNRGEKLVEASDFLLLADLQKWTAPISKIATTDY